MLTPAEFVKISHSALQAGSLKEALDRFIRPIRASVIFDNFVVYKSNQDDASLEVVYAKSLGRGKSAEADVSWGDILAAQIVDKKAQVLQQPGVTRTYRSVKKSLSFGVPRFIGRKTDGCFCFYPFWGATFF